MVKPYIEKISIAGPVGRLQAIYSVTEDDGDLLGVICHPNPLYGGTMDNKVVSYMARSLHRVGMPVIRFNFRGVGDSEGQFDNGIGETDDLKAVVQWIQNRHPARRLMLAGFSFGSYITTSVATDVGANGLVTIAPPVNLYDFTSLSVQCPWLVVMGDADEIVPVEKVRKWLEQRPEIAVRWIPGAGHFFHGRLPDISQHMVTWIQRDDE